MLYALLSIFGQISEYVPGNRTWWALNELSHSLTHLSLLDRMGDSRYRADAWSVFIDRYTELFYLWFKHWGVDPHAMEDVLQESMVRILGNIDSFHHNRHGSFRAWLKTVAYSSWKQLVEDTQRQLAQRKLDPVRAQYYGLIRSKPAEDHLLELFNAWAAEEVLNLAMARVRRRTAPLVWLTFERISLHNEPVAHVAQSLSIAPVQVYDRVSHVRKLMRQELADLGGLD